MKRFYTLALLSFLFLDLHAAKMVSPPRQKFITRALELKGTPYKWGGENPEGGLDCSGLINYINRSVLNGKVPFPRRAADIYDSILHIENKSREPGDLVFFSETEGGPIFHVGIYCGKYPKDGPEVKYRGKRVFVSAISSGEACIKISYMDEGYWTKYHPAYGRFLKSTDDYNKEVAAQKKSDKEKARHTEVKRNKPSKKNSSPIMNKPAQNQRREPKTRLKSF